MEYRNKADDSCLRRIQWRISEIRGLEKIIEKHNKLIESIKTEIDLSIQSVKKMGYTDEEIAKLIQNRSEYP